MTKLLNENCLLLNYKSTTADTLLMHLEELNGVKGHIPLLS